MTAPPVPRPWLVGLPRYRPGLPAPTESGRLASNEAAWPPPDAVVRAVAEAAAHANRYPDPMASGLRDALAKTLAVPAGHILLGNGSDELIGLLTQAYAAFGGTVVCADPPYGLHRLVPLGMGATVRTVPLHGWRHDLVAMAGLDADIVFVANPHNPTGTTVDPDALARFVRTARARLIVVDEAYMDFTDDPDGATLIAAAAESERVVVLRTMSKAYGLAGFRIGYLVGPRPVLDVLESVRMPFSVNVAAQAAGRAALAEAGHMAAVRDQVRVARARLTEELSAAGLEPIASQANFVLAMTRDEPGLVRHLEERGIAVRPGSQLGVAGTIRITVPAADAVPSVVHALRAWTEPGRGMSRG
jgi:histidinol-phosphate aminotransferase